MRREDVLNKYYDSVYNDYNVIWGSDEHKSMHYGYYDASNTHHGSALMEMNRVLAEIAKITSKDKILDAGCGVGGSALWLAENIGANVIGLNIHQGQLNIAEELAKKSCKGDLVEFVKGDYTATPFPDQSFDVIWALQSVSHAEDTMEFLKEAKRLLKKDGRIILSEAFIGKENLSTKEKKQLNKFLKGWSLPSLISPSKFESYLKNNSFGNFLFKHRSSRFLITPKIS